MNRNESSVSTRLPKTECNATITTQHSIVRSCYFRYWWYVRAKYRMSSREITSSGRIPTSDIHVPTPSCLPLDHYWFWKTGQKKQNDVWTENWASDSWKAPTSCKSYFDQWKCLWIKEIKVLGDPLNSGLHGYSVVEFHARLKINWKIWADLFILTWTTATGVTV